METGQIITAPVNEPIVYKPQAGGQTDFLSCDPDIFEVFFGGMAGPGKTWGLVIDALGIQFQDYVDPVTGISLGRPAYQHPQYRAYLFRRTTKRLGQVVDEAKKYYPLLGGKYVSTRPNEPGASFTFPYFEKNDKGVYVPDYRRQGAKIYFCHMEHLDDMNNIHGQEIHYAGLDEVPEFILEQYLFVFSRTRSTIPGLKARVRSTGNPIGVSLKKFRQRFIVNQLPNKVKYFIADKEPDKNPRGIEVDRSHPDALGRMFIPGDIDENLILMQNDPGYKSRIKAMGKKYELALLGGIWDAFEGQMFDMLSREIHVIPQDRLPEDFHTWRKHGGMDYGNTTVAEFFRLSPEGNVYWEWEWDVESKAGAWVSREQRATKLRDFMVKRGLTEIEITADTNMFNVNHELGEDQGEKTTAKVFENAGIKLKKVVKSSPDKDKFRIHCVELFKDLLMWDKSASSLWIQKPRMYFIEGRCPKLFETMLELQCDEDEPRDVNSDNDDDHWFDAAKYGVVGSRKVLSSADKQKIAERLRNYALNENF